MSRVPGRVWGLAWLTFVWMLLWGTWSLGDLVNGVLVALLVTTVLPLPRVQLGGQVHPLMLGRLAARFLADLVRSSVQVAWQAVRPGPPPVNSVIAVPLRTRSELVMTVTVEMLSLIPGSVVVELDTEQGVLYAHVLGADDDHAVELFRVIVHDLEQRVVAALGEPDEVREICQEVSP